MAVRNTHRLEVRLDDARRCVLDAELAERQITFADWVREKLDEVADRRALERRLAAVEQIAAMGETCPIDWGTPEELKEELSHAACPGAEFCGAPEYH